MYFHMLFEQHCFACTTNTVGFKIRTDENTSQNHF